MIWNLWYKLFPKPHAMHVNRDGVIRYSKRKPISSWVKRKVKGMSKKKALLLLALLPFVAAEVRAQSQCVAATCVNAFIKGINLPPGNPAIPVSVVNIASASISGTVNIVTTQTIPVSIAQVVTVTPSTNAFSINGLSFYRQDNYSAPGNGLTVNVSSSPFRTFAMQVTGTPAPATSWDVHLEGSLDGVNFTELLQHTDLIPGDGQTIFSGTSMQPVLYIRSKCFSLVLGGAASIAVIILGVQ